MTAEQIREATEEMLRKIESVAHTDEGVAVGMATTNTFLSSAIAMQLAEINAKTPSIRLQLAAMAMQGLLAEGRLELVVVSDALKLADALIAAGKEHDRR